VIAAANPEHSSLELAALVGSLSLIPKLEPEEGGLARRSSVDGRSLSASQVQQGAGGCGYGDAVAVGSFGGDQ
jgi:hypothetical protein